MPKDGTPTDYATIIPAPLMAISGVAAPNIHVLIDDFAVQFGLHAAFTTWIAAFQPARGAYTAPPSREDWETILAVIGAVPPGADLVAVMRRWIAALWLGDLALRERVTNPELRAAADRVVDLHQRAAAGEVIARTQWRAARTALDVLASDVDDPQAVCGSILGASAWDVAATPGVLYEVVAAWSELIVRDVDASIGWGTEQEAAHRAHAEMLRAFVSEWSQAPLDTRISAEQFKAELQGLSARNPAPSGLRAETVAKAASARKDLALCMLLEQIVRHSGREPHAVKFR